MSSFPPVPPSAPRLDELYQAEAARILTWARLRIRAEHRRLITAEDIAQDVWCRAVEKFAAYDPQRVTFRGWILTVARFVLAEATRRAFHHQRVQGEGRSTEVRHRDDLPSLITSVTTRAARDEAMTRLFEYVDHLDPIDRQVFMLHCLEELPQREVAMRLGIEENTVAKRWGRLRDRLRAIAPLWTGLVGPNESIAGASA